MGLSRTSWAISMFGMFLSGALRDYEITIQGLSYPYPDGALNIVTQDFLENGGDRMLIIDTDLLFKPQHVQMLLSHDVDFVAGIYPKKQLGLTFPIEKLEGSTGFDKNPFDKSVNPLVEVKRCARGFSVIKRNAFDRLIKSGSVAQYVDAQTKRLQWQFWKPIIGGHSEDFAFCDLLHEIGIPVYVDQRITLGHEGSAVYPIRGTFTKPDIE